MKKINQKFTKSKIYKKIERTFNDEVTVEDYVVHTFLLWSNVFLAIIALLEVFLHSHETFFYYAHFVEVVFGIVFLLEFILRIIFTYLKNSVYFKWTLALQFVIIVSLIAPHLFGNLAILRLVKSLKIIKIFILKEEQLHLSGKEALKKQGIFRYLHKINKKIFHYKINFFKK